MGHLDAADIAHIRERLAATWDRLTPDNRVPNQILGRKRVIGCVSLEVTQRCNFDCAICYLSENSEGTPDLPLSHILERVDRIHADYGKGTNVQISGGDPTLRDEDELEAIVRHTTERGLVPSLFTNGDLASRRLLERLTRVGLADVAFHVDLTEKRKGYKSEESLCEVRQEYIERARGLPLNVIFNQTVYKKNFPEVPLLVDFYKRNADVVGMASFQLQADTGRGANRRRDDQVISIETVGRKIEEGLGVPLSWDAVRVGSPKCHKIAYAAIVDPKGRAHAVDILDDPKVVGDLLDTYDDIFFDRRHPRRAAAKAVVEAVRRRYVGKGLAHFGRHVRANWRPLVRGRGRVHKLSFFMQNFQDATALDHERIDNCSFHCMTADGGVSMCVHNAYRDHYIKGGCGYPAAYQDSRTRDGFHPTDAGRMPAQAAK
ncbi:MAG: radical SAM protein [Myxococcales bacterium]|nr:radical SAM protein [Myxococcales bacterium]